MLKSIVLSGKKLSPEECRKNILDVFDMSTLEQREEGKQWYIKAHEMCFDVALKYMMPEHQVVGILSALSPRTSWEINQRKLQEVLSKGTTFATGLQMDKVKRIFQTDFESTVLDILNGEKTKNFYLNIKKPSSPKAVTIDTHAIRVAYKDFRREISEPSMKPNQYRFFAEGYVDVAKKLNVLPSQLQAITWVSIKSLYS